MSRSRAFLMLPSLAMIWTVGCDQGNVPSAPDMTSVSPAVDPSAKPQNKSKKDAPINQKTLGSALVD